MEDRLSDDSLMRSMPSLGRYSSLPDRHLRKQKARSDVDKFKNFSCYGINESDSGDVADFGKSEKEELADESGSMHLDVVHGHAYPDKQLVTRHFVALNDSMDDRGSKNNAEKAASCDADMHGDASYGDRKYDVDRTAVDDFVMKMVPSFGKYASLPPRRHFHPDSFYSSASFSPETTEKEHSGCRIPDDRHSNIRFGGDTSAVQRPLSDYAGQRHLNSADSLRLPSCQPKSSSCFDIGRPFEPNPAWLSFKSFDDTIQEFATDSAYQTSDSLKLQTFSLSKEELQTKIDYFNKNPDGLKIEMESETDVYHGCIHVLIDLIRPVDVRTSSRPSSIYDLHKTADNIEDTAPFLLPRSQLITVGMSSETSADQVIKDILNKCNITNNFGRFALFEKINRKLDQSHMTEGSSTVYLRKLSNKERPLELCLHSVDENADTFEERHFLLRENDKGEILWEAFSLPELDMFLGILLREEESYIEAIQKRYASLRNVLEQRMDHERRQNYDFLVKIQSPKSNSSFS